VADDKREVVVTDVRIQFWSMVVLLVKWAIAAIPALIILLVIGAVASAVMAAIFGGGNHHWEMNRWWGRLDMGNVNYKYLPLYVNEFEFRYNNRKNSDIFGVAI
jgi:hypothetical protein